MRTFQPRCEDASSQRLRVFSLWHKHRCSAAKLEDIGFAGGDPMQHPMSPLRAGVSRGHIVSLNHNLLAHPRISQSACVKHRAIVRLAVRRQGYYGSWLPFLLDRARSANGVGFYGFTQEQLQADIPSLILFPTGNSPTSRVVAKSPCSGVPSTEGKRSMGDLTNGSQTVKRTAARTTEFVRRKWRRT